MKETDYPALYLAADTASQENQRSFLIALAGNLLCLGVAAALSVINLSAVWFGLIQAIVLLGSVALTVHLATSQPQRLWYGTRALAESVKTITWRFMMRAEPFEADEAEARQQFIDALRKIFVSNQQVSARAVKMQQGHQITGTMLAHRQLPIESRKALYDSERIGEQHKWYIEKANQNACASKRWFIAVISINVAAIMFALGRIVFPNVDHWPTDFFVAASASVMAWLQTKRFQELAGSYTLTAHEIGLLRADMPQGSDERAFSVFVADSENAFSREHTQWVARRDAE